MEIGVQSCFFSDSRAMVLNLDHILDSEKIIYLFIFGCAGSLLLCGLFSRCGEWGLLSSCSMRSSHCGGFSCCRAGALGHAGLSCCSVWAQQLWYMGLVAPCHVESSQRRDQTHVPCIGSGILNQWTTGHVFGHFFIQLIVFLILGSMSFFVL